MPVVAFVLVGNTVFGLLAGGLFARHGLEAAIIAHVLAHLLASRCSEGARQGFLVTGM